MSEREGWRRYLRFVRPDLRADVNDELGFHLEMRVRDLIARGLSPGPARARAEAEFGAVGEIRDSCLTIDRRRARRDRRTEVLGDMWTDLRLALRSFTRRPGLAAAIVVTLALGIGASTSIFAVVDAAALHPLPFAHPDRLAMVWGVAGPQKDIRGASYFEVADWKRLTSAFTDLSIYDETNFNLSGPGQPARQLEAENVSPGFFRILGIPPAIGRALEPSDDQFGAPGVAVISDALWKSQFGGADVLGRAITLDGRAFTIVGVMPPGFKGLSFDTDIWAPLPAMRSRPALESRGNRWLGAVGRLKPGVSAEAAQQQLDEAAAQLQHEFPDANRDRGAELIPLHAFYLTSTRGVLYMLLGGAGLLLLIVCGNVANLQLVRASTRRRELSVRHALGASRGRVLRQLVTESIGLSAVGGVFGTALAWATLRGLRPLVPAGTLPAYVELRLNPASVAFALGVVVVVGALVGAIPAFRADPDPASALRESRASGMGWRAGWPSVQQLLVGAEVAFAFVLLAGAGLAVSSLRRQLAIPPGFSANGAIAARIALTGDRYAGDARTRFVHALTADVSGLPGVQQVAVGSDVPLRGNWRASFLAVPEAPDHRIRSYLHMVTPSYFSTLGIRLVSGRGFTSSDGPNAPPVAIVSRAFARRIWPGEQAVGKQLLLGQSTATVVGVASDVHFRDLTTTLMDPSGDPDVYFSFAQLPASNFDIVIRAAGDPADLAASLRRAVAAIDPAIPTYDVETLAHTLAGRTALARLASMLLAAFGVLSLALAAIGLYGVMAFIVRGRRREIAIRTAIGARPRNIVRMVLGQGMGVVGIGLIVGIAGALAMGRAVAGSLYGVSAADPGVLVGSAATLAVAALVANLIPMAQALRVDARAALTME